MLLNKVEEYLKVVLEHKRCIPYSRFDHSAGRCSAAIQFGLTKSRYPKKCVRIEKFLKTGLKWPRPRMTQKNFEKLQGRYL